MRHFRLFDAEITELTEPWPAWQFDGWWDSDLLAQAHAEAQQIPTHIWDQHDRQGREQIPWESFPWHQVNSEALKRVCDTLHSEDFKQMVSGLLQISPLRTEPGWPGLARTGRNSPLGMHTDYGYTPISGWRRVNVICYINPEWDESWGGDLQLASSPEGEITSVFPQFNRMVIFPVTRTTYHAYSGHTCPNDYRWAAKTYYANPQEPTEEGHDSPNRLLQLSI